MPYVGYEVDSFDNPVDKEKKFYTEILKRLDDSQDSIRIETTHVLTEFFNILPESWPDVFYEYSMKSIFIHLDDPNVDIQNAIYETLKAASRIHTATFISVARE